MNILNFNTANILLNTQPYPFGSIRMVYPTTTGDNTVSMIFPWWASVAHILWRGDVTKLINGQTGLPFTSLTDFQAFCDANIY